MAYLNDFANDLFVSYARGPKGPPSHRETPLQRWTSTFCDHLRHRVDFFLQQKDAAAGNIFSWIDKSISHTTPVDQSLKAEVERSALLVCVMSHYYLKSEYCLTELSTFKDDYADTGDKGQRIFVVNVTETIRETWPKALRMANGSAVPGYDCYEKSETDPDVSKPFDYPDPRESNSDYAAILDKVARDITRKLFEMKKSEASQSSKLPDIGDTTLVSNGSVGRSIFLGYAHDTLIGVRNQVRTRLESLGFTVLPKQIDDPFDPASLHAALSMLSSCDSAVLIANEFCGGWPRGEPGGFVSYQIEAFRAARKPYRVWAKLHDPIEAQTDAYEAYLTKLLSSGATRFADLESFCRSVHPVESPSALQMYAMVVSNRSSDGDAYVAFEDAIMAAISETGRLIYISNIGAKSDTIHLRELEKPLRSSDTLAIVCFDQDFDWAESLMGQLRQPLSADGRKRCQVLVNGPIASRPYGFDARTLSFETIDGLHLDIPALRAKLTQKLGRLAA